MASSSVSRKRKRSYSKACYVYVMQVDSGAVKIGKSFYPLNRLDAIQTANHEAVKLVFSFEMPNEEAAQALERYLHERYVDQKLRREWFAVNPDHIIEDIRFTVAFARLAKSIEYAEFNRITDEMRKDFFSDIQMIWSAVNRLQASYDKNLPVREGNNLREIKPREDD